MHEGVAVRAVGKVWWGAEHSRVVGLAESGGSVRGRETAQGGPPHFSLSPSAIAHRWRGDYRGLWAAARPVTRTSHPPISWAKAVIVVAFWPGGMGVPRAPLTHTAPNSQSTHTPLRPFGQKPPQASAPNHTRPLLTTAAHDTTLSPFGSGVEQSAVYRPWVISSDTDDHSPVISRVFLAKRRKLRGRPVPIYFAWPGR